MPDWPTNVAYFSTTPAEETYFYNSFYGPNGKFPYWPTNRTYEQIVGVRDRQALTHVATGSIYTHTFHIGNLRDYGSGRTLTTDWVSAVLAKYSELLQRAAAQPDLAGARRVHRRPQRTLRRAVGRRRRRLRPRRQHRDGHARPPPAR